jgi:hypothetical protein
MDTAIVELFDSGADEWIAALPVYQQRLVRPMLATADPADVAVAWLAASGPSDTEGFGAVSRGVNLFFGNLLVEIKALLCTEHGYTSERQKLASSAKAGRATFIAAVCAAVEPHIGASAVLLAPAVSMIFAVVGSAGKDSACTTLDDLIERYNTKN